jgi:hypothetical protein
VCVQCITKREKFFHSTINTCKRLVYDGALPTVPSYKQSTAEEVASYYVNTNPISKYVSQKHKAKTSELSRK